MNKQTPPIEPFSAKEGTTYQPVGSARGNFLQITDPEGNKVKVPATDFIEYSLLVAKIIFQKQAATFFKPADAVPDTPSQKGGN